MRNIIIKRKKEFSGSFINLKVYIEDYQASEITINGVPCRKIGELRNGEERAFTVGDNPAKIFVIQNKLTKNYINDFFQLPPGNQNIFLTGGNILNPLIGYRFGFDIISSEEVLINRKKNNKRFAAVFISAFAVLMVFGFFSGFAAAYLEDDYSENTSKIFTAEDMQITLTEKFSEIEFEGYTSCYDSNDIAVFTLKEDFSLFEGGGENYSLEDYAELVKINNGLTDDSLGTIDGLPYIEYEAQNPDNNITYYYVTFMYKTDNAFWIVCFTTEVSNSEKYIPQFIDWAKSVTFMAENKLA